MTTPPSLSYHARPFPVISSRNEKPLVHLSTSSPRTEALTPSASHGDSSPAAQNDGKGAARTCLQSVVRLRAALQRGRALRAAVAPVLDQLEAQGGQPVSLPEALEAGFRRRFEADQVAF